MPSARGTWTWNGLLIGSGAQQEPRSIAALTNGQIPVGSTGYPPVPATITGGGGISVAGGAGTVAITTRGYVSTTQVGTVGAGEDTLQTWTVPAATLVANSGVRIFGGFATAANGNTKTIKFYVGTAGFTLNPTTTAPNAVSFFLDAWVFYNTTTSGILWFVFHRVPGVIETSGAQFTSGGVDWTAGNTVIKCTGEGTATDDIVQYTMAATAFRTP